MSQELSSFLKMLDKPKRGDKDISKGGILRGLLGSQARQSARGGNRHARRQVWKVERGPWARYRKSPPDGRAG